MKQVAVGPKQGWHGWVMRIFTIVGKALPRVILTLAHINYIISAREHCNWTAEL
jgi:hypothetical protein